MKLTIDLPLPHEILHPNGRTRNHNYRAKLVKSARRTAELLAVVEWWKSKWKTCKQAEYTLTFYLPRKHDQDGLIAWVKPYLDGLADAGVIEIDSGFALKEVRQITGKAATGKRGVVITVEVINE